MRVDKLIKSQWIKSKWNGFSHQRWIDFKPSSCCYGIQVASLRWLVICWYHTGAVYKRYLRFLLMWGCFCQIFPLCGPSFWVMLQRVQLDKQNHEFEGILMLLSNMPLALITWLGCPMQLLAGWCWVAVLQNLSQAHVFLLLGDPVF